MPLGTQNLCTDNMLNTKNVTYKKKKNQINRYSTDVSVI